MYPLISGYWVQSKGYLYYNPQPQRSQVTRRTQIWTCGFPCEGEDLLGILGVGEGGKLWDLVGGLMEGKIMKAMS